MNIIIIGYFVFYIVSVVVCYGWIFAFFQGKFINISEKRKYRDMQFSITTSIFCSIIPIVGFYILCSYINPKQYGWKFK